jgi:hypothetical protein
VAGVANAVAATATAESKVRIFRATMGSPSAGDVRQRCQTDAAQRYGHPFPGVNDPVNFCPVVTVAGEVSHKRPASR